MSKRSIRRIVTEIIVIGILIFLIVFCVGFRVTKVEVKGNQFYSDEEIKKMVLDVPAAKNTLLAERFINTEEKTKEEALIERITIKRKKWNTLVLQVREKQMIGYFSLNGQCLNFDRQGVIQIITEEPIENVPLIDGLNVKEAKQGEKIKGINKKRLNTILSVGKMLEKTEQKPDRLVFNDLKQLVLYYGSIEVNMGTDENMDEKMNRLIGILPQLEGMEGVLHLENVTEDTASVVFDNAAEENSDRVQRRKIRTQTLPRRKTVRIFPMRTAEREQTAQTRGRIPRILTVRTKTQKTRALLQKVIPIPERMWNTATVLIQQADESLIKKGDNSKKGLKNF